MLIREITVKDAAEWDAMRCELWPDGDDHSAEIAAFFAGTLTEPDAVLVAEDDGLLIGFAELSVRRDVAGLEGKFWLCGGVVCSSCVSWAVCCVAVAGGFAGVGSGAWVCRVCQ